MHWRIIEKSDPLALEEMEAFVRTHPRGHFMQCPRWAKVKEFWDWRGIGVYEEGRMVGSLSVLIRPLPLGFSLLYGPRGPVCDREDPRVWEAFLEGLKQLARDCGALLLYLDPDEPDGNGEFRNRLQKLGFREKEDGGFGNIQPQYVFRLDLEPGEEAVFRAFSPKTRYNIGLSARRGVTTRACSGANPIPEEALDQFARLMAITGERDGFRVRGKDYFAALLKALGEDGILWLAFFEGKPIAGAIEVFCGEKAWYLYGASDNENRGTMPNYLLQWSMIREAFNRGCRMYDFRGVPGETSEKDPLYGLYRFKKGFSGTYTKFTGLFSYSFRPVLGFAMMKLIYLRRRWRHRKGRNTGKL